VAEITLFDDVPPANTFTVSDTPATTRRVTPDEIT